MKYPEVKVKLTGEDGNAFSIIGRCIQAAKRAKVPQEEINKFKEEAMSSNYDNLLCTVMDWFNCD
jgi:hypothetical protein